MPSSLSRFLYDIYTYQEAQNCDTIKAKFEYVTIIRIYTHTHTYYSALYVSIILGEYFLHNINNFVEHTKAVFWEHCP